jgi:hypothetical protein
MTTAIANTSFLTDVIAIDVDQAGAPSQSGNPLVDQTITDSLATGLPSIKRSDQDVVVMAVPVYRGGQIHSLAAIVGHADPKTVGVMEIWQPIGDYEELSLTQGYFAGLDRFQNVSSFVRFEKGSGLPGQVWRNLSFIVHDNLPSHAGFLRAAGASAESLQVAIGLPVYCETFLAAALLISSDASPIARGYEVWRCAEDHFLLEASAYQRLEQSLIFDPETKVALTGSLPGLALESGVVTVSDDPHVVFSGRAFRQARRCKGVAIPFYEGDRITNILTLLL